MYSHYKSWLTTDYFGESVSNRATDDSLLLPNTDRIQQVEDFIIMITKALLCWEKFEDIKRVIRSRKSKKDRQYNGQYTNNDLQNTKYWTKLSPQKFWGELSLYYFIVKRRYFYFFLVFKATFHNSLVYRHGQIIGGLSQSTRRNNHQLFKNILNLYHIHLANNGNRTLKFGDFCLHRVAIHVGRRVWRYQWDFCLHYLPVY